jgi:hypothetical protein
MPEPTEEQRAIQLAIGQERIRRAFNTAITCMQKMNQPEEDINLLIGIYKDIMKPAEPKTDDEIKPQDE